MEDLTTTARYKSYNQVTFRNREGHLTLSPYGIIFCSIDDDGKKKDSLIYKVPWNRVKKHRLNAPFEPEDSLRLSVSADYGEGEEEEVSVFDLPSRKELELLGDHLQEFVCFFNDTKLGLDNKKDTETERTADETICCNRTASSISSVSQWSTQNDTLTPISSSPREEQSLLLMVYEYLIAASEEKKKDFARGITHASPDNELQVIYELEKERQRDPGNFTSQIDLQTPRETQARVQQRMSRAIEDMGKGRIGESDAKEENVQVDSVSLSSVHSTHSSAKVDNVNFDTISKPPTREPNLLAGPTANQMGLRTRSGGSRSEEAREILNHAKRMDAHDRQVKEQKGMASLAARRASMSAEARLSRISPAIKPSRTDHIMQHATLDTCSAPTVTSSPSSKNHEDLKERILMLLKQDPSGGFYDAILGPGAFAVRDNAGEGAQQSTAVRVEATTPIMGQSTGHEATLVQSPGPSISTSHLIEAYLVAQDSARVAPMPPQNEVIAENKPEESRPEFWELSEESFLDALAKVMLGKCTEAVPVAANDTVMYDHATAEASVRRGMSDSLNRVREPVAPAAQHIARTKSVPRGDQEEESCCCFTE